MKIGDHVAIPAKRLTASGGSEDIEVPCTIVAVFDYDVVRVRFNYAWSKLMGGEFLDVKANEIRG